MKSVKARLIDIYNALYKRFGPQAWWPGDGPFEVIIGAILTQNTDWRNVEKAIENLKRKRLISPCKLKTIKTKTLSQLIRPSGYFNIKAHRLKEFINFFFKEYNGSLKNMQKQPLYILRNKLLNVHGIGKETADSILLYALNKPIFVVDAYTKRILERLKIIDKKAGYDNIHNMFMDNLKHNVKLFNEFHALFVRLGKEICTKSSPKCDICPLNHSVFPVKLNFSISREGTTQAPIS